MSSPETLLDVQHVSTTFANRARSGAPIVAVDDVSLQLRGDQPTLLAIVGESGSGKTTLTRNIVGLTRPTSGTIYYRGKDIYRMSRPEWAVYQREVQPVFQDPYATYNPFYRIDRILEVPIRKFKLASSHSEAQGKIADALSAVDLRAGDVLGRYPHQLSGGERQRLMLARIFLIRPRLILADEAVSMIDAALRTLFLNILLDFRDKLGSSCIFITHNLSTAYYLGGDMLIMCKGRVVEYGDMDAIIAKPAHPYTQQLIESVPSPDPDQRWHSRPEKVFASLAEIAANPSTCIYTARCPHVMPVCQTRRPALVSVSGTQDKVQAACFLYGGEAEQPSAALEPLTVNK